MAAGTNTVHVGGRTLPLPVATVRRAVATVLAGERRRATISITFLGPVVMRRMNREHKNHDWPTDVLSFPLTGPGATWSATSIYVARSPIDRRGIFRFRLAKN